MSNLSSIISDINKKYKFEIIGKSKIKEREYNMIPCASPALSYIFHGGLPNTIIQLLGMPSSGKSTLAYSICGQAQKLFKKQWEESDKSRDVRKVLYIDLEYTTNNEWLEKNGVDVDELLFIAPQNQTAEEIFQICLDVIDSGDIGLVVLDSVPALVSQQAMDKTIMEKTYAGISSAMTTFCSKLLPLCNRHKCGFIFVNQPRIDMGGYNRVMFPGGQMLKHTFSINIMLKKGAYLDENYNELKAHPEDAHGNLVEVEVLKNKATKPDRRMSRFSISYDSGIDGLNDTVIMSVGIGIVQKSGSWYVYNFNGDNLKWQGKANMIKELKTNKVIFDSIYEKVMEYVRCD